MWSCKVTCQIKYVISLLSPGLCPLKLHMVIYYEVLPPMNSHKHLDIHSLVSKVSSVVTKGETLTTINSHGQSIKWFFEVTWQIKSMKSYLSQYLLSPILTGCWLATRSCHLWSHVILWPCGPLILIFLYTVFRFRTCKRASRHRFYVAYAWNA